MFIHRTSKSFPTVQQLFISNVDVEFEAYRYSAPEEEAAQFPLNMQLLIVHELAVALVFITCIAPPAPIPAVEQDSKVIFSTVILDV